MSEPPYDPPTEPPNVPPSGPPPSGPPPAPPPNPGQWIPPEQLPQPAYPVPQPPPPPPRKSYAGLIIGLAVVGVGLVAGILAIVLLAGSESESDNDSEAADETTSSTEPTPEETPSEPAGPMIQGNGYSYELPDEWRDLTADVVGQSGTETIDTTSAPGASIDQAPANLIVEAGPANGETDLEAARDQVSANLGGVVGATPVEIEGPNVDGVATVGLEVTSTTATGVKVLQTAYVTLLHDTYYVIGYSRESDNHDYDEDFEAILDSWVWEG